MTGLKGEFPTIPPGDAGFAADLVDKLDAGIYAGLLTDVHAVLISRGGKMVLERYYPGKDEIWGRPLGVVTPGPDSLYDLRSVTKSIVSLLYGIALDTGLVPPPEAPLLAQFPGYDDLAAEPRRASLTICHALTMTLGMDWDEQRPGRASTTAISGGWGKRWCRA